MRKSVSRSRTITIPWEVEELIYNGQSHEVFVELSLRFEPGDPGCYRTPNGDGWPPVPATIELERVRVIRATPHMDFPQVFDRSVACYFAEAEECQTIEWLNILEAADRHLAGDDCDE